MLLRVGLVANPLGSRAGGAIIKTAPVEPARVYVPSNARTISPGSVRSAAFGVCETHWPSSGLLRNRFLFR